MTTICGPPMSTPPTRMCVSSGFISRLVSLNGRVTRMTSITPGSPLKIPGSTGATLPVMPIAVRDLPGIGLGVRPRSRTARQTLSISSTLASVRMTINIGLLRSVGSLWPTAFFVGHRGPTRLSLRCFLQLLDHRRHVFAVADGVDESTAHDCAVGDAAQGTEVCRLRDSETDGDRCLCQ